MNKYFARFNGVGAATHLSLGGIPKSVKILAAEDGDLANLFWNEQMMASAECCDGIIAYTGTTYQQWAALTAGTGVRPYYGGDSMTAANQTSLAFGGVNLFMRYVGEKDLKADLTYGVVSAINKWTLTAGTNTGYFNADVLHCVAGLGGTGAGHIGEGSLVMIRETGTKLVKTAFIHAAGNTAGDAGGAASEITLSEQIASGEVLRIGPAFSFEPVPIGEKAGPGIHLARYTGVNVVLEAQTIEWEM